MNQSNTKSITKSEDFGESILSSSLPSFNTNVISRDNFTPMMEIITKNAPEQESDSESDSDENENEDGDNGIIDTQQLQYNILESTSVAMTPKKPPNNINELSRTTNRNTPINTPLPIIPSNINTPSIKTPSSTFSSSFGQESSIKIIDQKPTTAIKRKQKEVIDEMENQIKKKSQKKSKKMNAIDDIFGDLL